MRPRGEREGPAIEIAIRGPVALGSFLKLAGAAHSGGEAKTLIQAGLVLVNGAPETRRAHTVRSGDAVEVRGRRYLVTQV